jgi:hypothetical protein
MPRYWVKLKAAVDIDYGRVLVEAADAGEAEQHVEEARLRGDLPVHEEHIDHLSFEVQLISHDDDDAHEALLPDGGHCPWDERLRTTGALRVPKKPTYGATDDG